MKLFRESGKSIDLITSYTHTEYVLQELSYFFLKTICHLFKLDAMFLLKYI